MQSRKPNISIIQQKKRRSYTHMHELYKIRVIKRSVHDSLFQPMRVKLIMGLKPMDYYDAFVQKLHDLRIDDMIAMYQSALGRYLKR